MSSETVLNPPIPYVGAIDGKLVPGRMVKVQGKVPPDAVRFAVNYQLGPTLNPRDDIAIHVSPRFPEGFITRNHIESMSWGVEENGGPMCIQPGQEFEILLLCDHTCYKIAINGRHFAEFAHRLPYENVTHLVVDGDVVVHSISYELVPIDPPRSPRAVPTPDVPAPNFGPPPPGGLYPTIGQGPQDGYGPSPPVPGYGPPPGPGYGPPPGPGYGPPPGAYGGPGYNNPKVYGYQPGYDKPEEEDAFGGCLDKVGLALGGLVAAGGIAAAAHALNKKKEEDPEKDHEKSDASKSKTESEGGLGNLGSLGAALASSLVSNALSNSSAQQGYPAQQPSGGGGVLGSILGALGGNSGHNVGPPPPSQTSDPLTGTLGSLLGGVLGGGGNQQPSYQPSGGYGNYQPPGGYPNQQPNSGSDLLSGLGSAIGSSLFNSALGGLSGHGKDKSHGGTHSSPPPTYTPSSPAPTKPPASDDSASGNKLSADEISKGLGLDD